MTSHRSDEPRLFWEDFRRLYPVKAFALAVIIALTVVSCGKEASLSLAIDDLNYDSLPAKAPRPTKPAEKLHAAVVELKELLAVQSGKNLTEKQAEQARKARAAVAGNLAAVEKQFAADREKLGDLEAKDALKRLAVIEGKTDEIKSDLIDALAVVPKTGEKTSSARTAIKQLTALSPDKPQQPLSSDLSFGIKNAKPRSVSLSAGITPAYQAPSPDAEPSNLPREPEPADLEETDETKITPAIEQLATELDHDPVKIYEYVRNNVKFEPYYGIRKGADQTLAEKAGSDADQAALLIALMRESGVPARFVQGVAELPAAKAANWLGVDITNGERMDAVPEILWSGGIPTTPVRANGGLARVQFAHFWIEAYVPTSSYRGVDEGVGGASWLPLDPSVKGSDFIQPNSAVMGEIDSLMGDWASNFFQRTADSSDHKDESLLVSSDEQTAEDVTELRADVSEVLADESIDHRNEISQVFGGTKIGQVRAGLLPASTPFKLRQVDSESRRVSNHAKARIVLEIRPSSSATAGADSALSFSTSTDNVANRRLTVSSAPSSAADAEVIDNYGGVVNAPSYAVRLVPRISIDGEVVSAHSISSTMPGESLHLVTTYIQPGFAPRTVVNSLVSSSVIALSLGLGHGSPEQIAVRRAELKSRASSTESSSVMRENIVGEFLSQIASSYFARNDRTDYWFAQSVGVVAQRQLSGAFAGTSMSPTLIAGFPVAISVEGSFIDVDQDVLSAVELSDTPGSLDAFQQASSNFASTSESAVFQGLNGERPVSTVEIFDSAAKASVPIFAVSRANFASVIPKLDHSALVLDEVERAVTSGDAIVAIPQRAIQVGSWEGSGYVIRSDKSSDYRISGATDSSPTSGGMLPVSQGSASGLADLALQVVNWFDEAAYNVLNCLVGVNDVRDLVDDIILIYGTRLVLLAVPILVAGPWGIPLWTAFVAVLAAWSTMWASYKLLTDEDCRPVTDAVYDAVTG